MTFLLILNLFCCSAPACTSFNFARNKIFSSDLQLHLLHFSFRFVIATCVDSTAGSFANKFNKGFFGIEMFHDCIVIPKKMSLYDNFAAGVLTE